jgi:hypothetical protein
MKKMARSIRNHRELILNWFRAKKEFSSGVVEGLNNSNRSRANYHRRMASPPIDRK